MGLGKAFKKVGKAVSSVAKTVAKPVEQVVKTTYKPIEKVINPLGIGHGGDLFNQRIRKLGKIGVGTGAGFLTGGIPGAFAGGGVAAINNSKKGAGHNALNWRSALNSAGQGAVAGGLTGALAHTGIFAPTSPGTAGIGGVTSKSGTATPWGKVLAGSAINGIVQNKMSPSYAPPSSAYGPQFDPAQAQLDNQNYVQNILDAFNKRKERYFYA